MNEAETRAEHIDPALQAAGWGVVEGSRILREYEITKGRLTGQVFLGFVLTQYVKVGVEELDRGKLSPLLKLKYHNAISDAWADLGRPEEVGYMFAGFQKYLYQPGA
jgi:hypothetical protein